jgi:hypothetical protein
VTREGRPGDDGADRDPADAERAQRIRESGRAERIRSTPGAPETETTHATLALSPDLLRELDRVADDTAIEYRWAFDAGLDPERHVAPLVVALGLERLGELEPEAVREALSGDDRLADPPDAQGAGERGDDPDTG